MTRFTIYSALMPSPRPRVTRNGTYMPKKYTKLKDTIRYTAMCLKPFERVPLKVTIEATYKAPKSVNRRKYHMPLGDVDNLAKTVLDALNGVLFEDDTQVVDLRVKKRYGDEDSFTVTIEEE